MKNKISPFIMVVSCFSLISSPLIVLIDNQNNLNMDALSKNDFVSHPGFSKKLQ